MSNIICPRCNLAMNTITFREWEVKLCPRCEGTFYKESVLEELLRQPDLRLSYLRPAILPNLATPHPEETERERIHCPISKEVMTREPYSSESPILVDRSEHGIWLDDGELGHLLRELEELHPPDEPGFFEGLRRLVGLKPALSAQSSSADSSD